MRTITFDNIEYVSCDDVMKEAPIYSKNSRNTRSLIKRKGINDDMYIFAKQNGNGKWIKTDGKSIKFDKVFLRKDYLNNIPELSDNDAEIVDDNGILTAPPIIELNDNEKFKDDDGNIVDIETRGTRNCDNIYFKVKDVGNEFEINNLQNAIVDKNRGYDGKHYKYFICKKKVNDVKKTKKELFLTYEGLLRVLFVSRSGKTRQFIKWATETLFTVQLGTKEQKEELVSGIIGIPAKSLRQVLSKSSTTVPCIYRFSLGRCGDLRKKMKISKEIPDDHTIIKYGYTDNLVRRTREHVKTYEEIKGVKLGLMNYTYVDPKYLSNAEVDIKEFFEDIEIPIKYKYYAELVAINPKHEKQINKQFKYMSNEYSGCVKDLIDKIEKLKRDITDNKLEIVNLNKVHELEIKNRDIIIEKQQVEIENRDLKLKIYELQNK